MFKYSEYLQNSVATSPPPSGRNQPCCIKIVKWFCRALVERFESFARVAHRHIANENSRVAESAEERSRADSTGDLRRMQLLLRARWRSLATSTAALQTA